MIQLIEEVLFAHLLSRRGPTKWRDGFLPLDILEDWIKAKGLPEPEWAPDGRSVTIDGESYSIDQFGKIIQTVDNQCLF